mgnify:CR=1 FL=1
MIMSILGLNNKISFEEGNINVLEIYNKKLFYNLITILNESDNSMEDNQIVLMQNDERVSIGKNVFLLTDVFNIDFNSKKILNKLYSTLIENIKNRQDDELENITLKLRNYLIEEINELPFEFSIKNELELNDLLKAFELKIDTICYTTVVERIEFIIDIISTLKIATILVIPNLKIYLDENELLEIYKYSIYNNVQLLIIENSNSEELLKYEIKNIIDEEFDEF